MAVNEGLTLFNLVDGIVDEFNNESGVDTAENTNVSYDSTSDFYTNDVTNPSPATTNIQAFWHNDGTFNDNESTDGGGASNNEVSPFTYTAPANATAVDLLVIGGGGAGGGNFRGGGGGAGAYRTNWNNENQGGGQSSGAAKTLNAEQTYSIIVGAKGSGSSGNDGGDGSSSTFDDIVSSGGAGGGIFNGGDGRDSTGSMVDLVVVVLGNMELVLHLTKAHSLVGHLTETLEVTDTLVVKPMLVVVEVLVQQTILLK